MCALVTGVQTCALPIYGASFSTCGLSEPRCPWESQGDSSGLRRACNFHAISRMGSRNKIQVASQIGRFGIGFVSVYQITDSPVVRSGNTEMRLDPVQGQGVTRKNEAEQDRKSVVKGKDGSDRVDFGGGRRL